MFTTPFAPGFLLSSRPKGPDPARPPLDGRCPFIEKLPCEVRAQIFKYLLGTEYTKTLAGTDTAQMPLLPRWNLHVSILYVSRMIHEEARAVMGLENKFVVTEWAIPRLKKKTRKFLSGIWSKKICAVVDVPGEVMRLRFDKPQSASVPAYFGVLLAQDLICVIAKLSQWMLKGECVTKRLQCHISVASGRSNDSPVTRKSRELALLKPLKALRFSSHVSIDGTSSSLAEETVAEMESQRVSAEQSFDTARTLHAIGRQYSDAGIQAYALSYYTFGFLHVSQLLKHGLQTRIIYDAISAIQYHTRMLEALACIRADDYEKAYAAADIVLLWVEELLNIPPISDFPDGTGTWNEDIFQLGPSSKRYAEYCRKATRKATSSWDIACEDIGRCFYYRSIAGEVMGAPDPEPIVDRQIALSLCLIAHRKGVLDELLLLEREAMERLVKYERPGKELHEALQPLQGTAHVFVYKQWMRDIPGFNKNWERR